MATDKNLSYRGDIRAAVGDGKGAVCFVTVHPEGQPTALYRIDTGKQFELSSSPLPAGGVALARDGDTLFVAGADGQLYTGPAGGGAMVG